MPGTTVFNAVSAGHPQVLQTPFPDLTTLYNTVEERLQEDVCTCGSFWISMPFLLRGHGEVSGDMLRGSPGSPQQITGMWEDSWHSNGTSRR